MRCRFDQRKRASRCPQPSAIDRLDEESARESAGAIRAKNRFWRAPMRRDAGGHENFFIAKNGDSESAQRVWRPCSRLATGSIAPLPSPARFTKRPSAIGFSIILTNVSAAFPHTCRIAVRMRRRCGDQRASRALTPPRQHFLKADTVFFDVLVYSGCSAFRFPSARSDTLHRRASWPRKLRRRRRRRAQ